MFVVGFLLLVLYLIAMGIFSEQTAVRTTKFPPISDEEFLAKCDLGTNPKIALKVRRILADSLGLEYETIHPNASLVKDLDCC